MDRTSVKVNGNEIRVSNNVDNPNPRVCGIYTLDTGSEDIENHLALI